MISNIAKKDEEFKLKYAPPLPPPQQFQVVDIVYFRRHNSDDVESLATVTDSVDIVQPPREEVMRRRIYIPINASRSVGVGPSDQIN